MYDIIRYLHNILKPNVLRFVRIVVFYTDECIFRGNAATILSDHGGDDACSRRQRRNRGSLGPGTATAAAVGPIRTRDRRLRPELRLRRCRPRARRRRPSGHGHQQDGALRGPADLGRVRAVRGLQAGPVRVRGRIVPAGGTAAQVQPGVPARAHDRAEGDGRRAVRHCAKDVRGRARRARVQAARGASAGSVTVLQLSAD